MTASPLDHRNCAKGAPGSTANMAAAQVSKARSTSKASNNANTKSKTQMHRRSRTGCYTCRLRRKKCDEGTPICTACRHLGLQCEYKRPVWWSNNEARRKHKEDIKNIIKRKKLAEKTSSSTHASVSPPPGLSRSLPTSSAYSDVADHRRRSTSVDSHYSAAGFNFNSPPCVGDFGIYGTQVQMLPDHLAPVEYLPYEVDVKTERQMFVDDVPTLCESHVATFSTYQTPPPPGTVLSAAGLLGENACACVCGCACSGASSGAGAGAWRTQHPDDHRHHHHNGHAHAHHRRRHSLAHETLDVNFFDFAHGPHHHSRQVHIELEDGDQRLLDHFIHHVLPIIFPILESNQHGSVGSDLILPALQSNSVYLHCCLSIAAQHLKTHANLAPADIDGDIMKHRCATIISLCDLLQRDENHQQMLEAALGLIFFQCIVGRFDDGLLDISWHQHFQAVVSLVQKLDLPSLVSDPACKTPFNMTLAGWIDILGATMQGTSPIFAGLYREKLLSQTNCHLGLRELMGCDDRVMYLISEIACLDSLKAQGTVHDYDLCQFVTCLGQQLTLTEVGDVEVRMPYSDSGILSPKQLCRNITAAFRIAARIYLCSLIPGFSPSQESPQKLIDRLALVLQCIPAGPHGYDRSLVWVYLIAASVALPDSEFRDLFEERVAQLGDAAKCGAFGRMTTVVGEVWKQADRLAEIVKPGSTAPLTTLDDLHHPYVNWRSVMQSNDWEFLLI